MVSDFAKRQRTHSGHPTHKTLAENLGTSVKMLEDHYVKLSDDATGEVVEAHAFKLGLRVMKAA